MHGKTFDFLGADGQQLSGRLDLPDGAPRAVALFAHCFTCTKNSVAAVRVARALTGKGFAVLRFDFTGLGSSDGDFADTTFSASVRDLVAAGNALSERLSAPGLLVGHSLGGTAAIAAALDLPSVLAVATIGAPHDPKHVTHLFAQGLETMRLQGWAEVKIGGRPFRIRQTFVDDLGMQDSNARIRQLRRALLILHSPRDETVDIDNAAAIFQAAVHPKSFVSLHDADHLLTRRADADYCAEVIAAWASRYFVHPLMSQNSAPERSGEGHDGGESVGHG